MMKSETFEDAFSEGAALYLDYNNPHAYETDSKPTQINLQPIDQRPPYMVQTTMMNHTATNQMAMAQGLELQARNFS